MLADQDDALLTSYVAEQADDRRASYAVSWPSRLAGHRSPGVLRLGDYRGWGGRADPASSPCCRPPAATPQQALSGTVFKIERGQAGQKVAYPDVLRQLRAAGPVPLRPGRRHGHPNRALSGRHRYGRGPRSRRPDRAGLGPGSRPDRRPGRRLAAPGTAAHFAPPTLETVVSPGPSTEEPRRCTSGPDRTRRAGPADRPAPRRPAPEIAVSLYGEVQKEVIEATLADEYGLR